MLAKIAPAHLLAGTLLWAACGRIGYQEINDTIGGSAGGASSTGSVSVGASGSLATTGIGAGGAPVGTTSTSTGSSTGGSSTGGSSTGGGSTGGASGSTGSSAGGSVGTAGSSGTSGSAGATGTAGMTGSGGNGGNGGSGGSTGGGGSGSGGSSDAGVPGGCTAASFNGHNYLLCSTLLAQPDAVAACASNGMLLARVDDATENQWIVNTLFGPVLPGDQVTNWIWIGGSDAVTEGSWLWPDGTLFYQNGPVGGLYNHWGQAEPNNARGGENCLALRVNYNWTDIQCPDAHFFCCEQ
jgi:Lectin C-type domain